MSWIILAVLVSLPVRAAMIDGVGLPDTYPVGSQMLVLNGLGIRRVTIFHVRVYLAGLYLVQRSHDPATIMASPEPKVVLMQFLHTATKQQIDDHYREGEQRNCVRGGCNSADAAEFKQLMAATPPMKVGDTLTYIFAGPHVRVLANNRVIDEFTNQDLAQHLLAGFIGPTPPSPDLKAAMLGLASN